MRILFIDDEERRMKPVVEELKAEGYDVIFQSQVDSAVKVIDDSNEEFGLIIIDVSMPPGEAFQAEETYGGARTGFPLYDHIRKMRPKIPVVVYTNVADRGVEERFRKEERYPCVFIRKPSVLPFQFVEEIKKLTGKTV